MLVALSLVIVIFILRFALPAGTPHIRLNKTIDSVKTIAVLEKINIGGSEQWILERSENTDNPVILFLHGGPGTSQLTSNRRDTKDLEKSFIVVNWDQRGAGKSYNAIRNHTEMNIDQFVQDTLELTLYLQKKFRKDRIILIGHSWGSLLAAITVSKYPELYYCYIGIGQVANMAENESASYKWTLDQAIRLNDKRAIAKLQSIGNPPYKGDWMRKTLTERRLLGHFGGELHGSKIGAFGLVIKSVLFSREYNLFDRINYFRGIFGSMKILWPQLFAIDLFTSVTEFKIPVYLLEGRFDHESPSEIAERYFNIISAPLKELIWFENSAHLPNSEEKNKFNKILVNKILPAIRKNFREINPT
jgi:pimeloyl-ACP methyl ester carboxylesterase